MKGPMKIKTSVLFKEIAVDSKLHVLIGNEGPPFSWPISLNRACQQLIREKKKMKIHPQTPEKWAFKVSIERNERSERNKQNAFFKASEASLQKRSSSNQFSLSKALQQLSSNNCHHLSIIFHHLQSWSRHRGACSIRQAGQTGEESRRKETAVPTFFTCIKLPSPIAGDTFELRSRGVIPTLLSSSS